MNHSEVSPSDSPRGVTLPHHYLVVKTALHRLIDFVCERVSDATVVVVLPSFVKPKRFQNVSFVNLALSAAYYKGDQRHNEFSVHARTEGGWVVSDEHNSIELWGTTNTGTVRRYTQGCESCSI